MKRFILTLCLIMIALIGASAVAAYPYASNSHDVNEASTSNSEDSLVIQNTTFKNATANNNDGAIYASKISENLFVIQNYTLKDNKVNYNSGATYAIDYLDDQTDLPIKEALSLLEKQPSRYFIRVH